MPAWTTDGDPASRSGNQLVYDPNSWLWVRCLALTAATASRLAADSTGASDEFWMALGGATQGVVEGAGAVWDTTAGVVGAGLNWSMVALLLGGLVVLNSAAGRDVVRAYVPRRNPRRQRR